ncbi:hypothetical protein L596_025111 [Steinernema carpocapsae]|uniref:CCR4-Not complex component Not1 C-terminal domain-containing protein n=1 Tax=Steinernema carpocapsae TaxID=34508 RepID=A0A4U5M6U6_STECR|nr:hypothetical protein L596_025111 [Steinernema carpocapsae]
MRWLRLEQDRLSRSISLSSTTMTSVLPRPKLVKRLFPHLKIKSHLALFQAFPNLKHTVRSAITQAVKEYLEPVTDRAIKVAMSMTEFIVKKDFILDGEEKNLRRAAHQMMRAMTAGMAAITCREPLSNTIATYLKQYFQNQLSSQSNVADLAKDIDEAIQEITADNVELATSFIVKSACEKASVEVDKRLAPEYKERIQAKIDHKPYIGSQTHLRIQDFMPEEIRVTPGPTNPTKFRIYDEFVKRICGFKAASIDDMLLDLLAKNPGGVGAAVQHSQMLITNVDGFVAEMQKIVERIDERVNHVGQTPNRDELKSFKALLLIKELFSQAIAYPKDSHIITPLLQRVVEQFLNAYEVPQLASTPAYSKVMQWEWSGFLSEAFISFCKCLALHINQNDIIARITQIICECNLEYRFNIDAVAFLLRKQLLTMPIYDQCLAAEMDSVMSQKIVQFVSRLIRNMMDHPVTKGQVAFTPHMMSHCCEVLKKVQAYTKQNAAAATQPQTPQTPAAAPVAEPVFEKPSAPASESLQAKRPPGTEGDVDPELQMKVENILKTWIQFCGEASFQKDPQSALQRIVQMMHEQGVLATDEMITRFLRMCTDMIIDVSYKMLKQNNQPATRNRCYLTLDAFVKLTCLMIKHSDGNQYHTKINLLKKVLSIVTTVAQQDHDHVHKQDFQSMPYHRILISMFNELTVPDPVLEPIGWNILEAFGQALFILQPRRTPGFAFSWLDIIGHRNFIARILTRGDDSSEKARAMYTQLIICHLKFLSPYLRNLNLTSSLTTMYTGTLRVLLVILHDFPEVLCEYHYVICDAIPPNCVQLRNLVLSAYPRGMKLPDPFNPALLSNLPDMQEEPKINRVVDIFRQDIREKLDDYLNNRTPVSFLSELPLVLQVNSTPGAKYNMSVINSIVLYVGIRAVESIREQSLPINMTTIAHSAYMDVFQNLSVRFCTEGRYLLFNAITNQLRYPNAHTNYFSQTLLYLFREANSEEIQEQITRILFERLIAIRPHPWGLLITFIELIRYDGFGFWNHDFVTCAPEIERLFQTVASSCNVHRTPLTFAASPANPNPPQSPTAIAPRPNAIPDPIAASSL